MHGLINKSVQSFLLVTYGAPAWEEIAMRAQVPVEGFESMMLYDDEVTQRVLEAACEFVDCEPNSLLEDIGTYLVTNPDLEAVRRLMRFGGPSFEDFILSLDEVHDRGRMAVPDLTLPKIALRDSGGGHYVITTTWALPGAVALVSGLLRAMADDYGALAVLDAGPCVSKDGQIEETLAIFVAEHEFSEGRSFLLGESVA